MAVRLTFRSIASSENDMANPNVIEKLDMIYIRVAQRMVAFGPILATITRNQPLEQVWTRYD